MVGLAGSEMLTLFNSVSSVVSVIPQMTTIPILVIYLEVVVVSLRSHPCQNICMCQTCLHSVVDDSDSISEYFHCIWMLIPRRLCRGFLRHSLSDTSFNSWGLVPSSHLFCNYIVLQHICTQAHTRMRADKQGCMHTPVHTHRHPHRLKNRRAHTNIYSIFTSTHIGTHIPSLARVRHHPAPASSNHQSCLYETERRRWSEGRSAKQSEKHQRQ